MTADATEHVDDTGPSDDRPVVIAMLRSPVDDGHLRYIVTLFFVRQIDGPFDRVKPSPRGTPHQYVHTVQQTWPDGTRLTCWPEQPDTPDVFLFPFVGDSTWTGWTDTLTRARTAHPGVPVVTLHLGPHTFDPAAGRHAEIHGVTAEFIGFTPPAADGILEALLYARKLADR